MEEKTFNVKYVDGHTEISVYPKLSRGHSIVFENGKFVDKGNAVMYKTTRDGKMIGRGCGFFSEIQRRFRTIRNNFATEEEFLAHLGIDKSKMEHY